MTTHGRFIAIETVTHTPQQVQHALQGQFNRADVRIMTTPSLGDLGRLQAERAPEQPNWLERIYGGLADLHDLAECEGGILSLVGQGQHVVCIGYCLSLGALNLPSDDQFDWYLVTSQQLPLPDASFIAIGDDDQSLRLRCLAEADPQAEILTGISDDWQPLIDRITSLLPTDGGDN